MGGLVRRPISVVWHRLDPLSTSPFALRRIYPFFYLDGMMPDDSRSIFDFNDFRLVYFLQIDFEESVSLEA